MGSRCHALYNVGRKVGFFSFCCFVLDMRHGEADGALHHGVSHLIHHQPVISRDESERWEIAGGEVPIVFMNVVIVRVFSSGKNMMKRFY